MGRRVPFIVLVLVAVSPLLARSPFPGVHAARQEAQAHGLTLHPARQAANDLEITGLPALADGFLTHAELEGLPQVSTTLTNDPDFPSQTVHASGVRLEVLLSALGSPASLDLVEADCTDKYRSHFPLDYIASHHPIVILALEGMPLDAWAEAHHAKSPGPYLVRYDHFVPDFKVLSHNDEPQLPVFVTRLRITSQAVVFAPLSPPATAEAGAQQGFAIAKQNCLRCHALGASGGHKSVIDWSTIGIIATSDPKFFAGFVRNPQATMPKVAMPPNPEYDDATLAALTAYFKSMSPKAATKR